MKCHHRPPIRITSDPNKRQRKPNIGRQMKFKYLCAAKIRKRCSIDGYMCDTRRAESTQKALLYQQIDYVNITHPGYAVICIVYRHTHTHTKYIRALKRTLAHLSHTIQ